MDRLTSVAGEGGTGDIRATVSRMSDDESHEWCECRTYRSCPRERRRASVPLSGESGHATRARLPGRYLPSVPRRCGDSAAPLRGRGG